MAAVGPQVRVHVPEYYPQELGKTWHTDGRTTGVQGTSPACRLGEQRADTGERQIGARQARKHRWSVEGHPRQRGRAGAEARAQCWHAAARGLWAQRHPGTAARACPGRSGSKPRRSASGSGWACCTRQAAKTGVFDPACQRKGMGMASACLMHVRHPQEIIGGEGARAHWRRVPSRPRAGPWRPAGRPYQTPR